MNQQNIYFEDETCRVHNPYPLTRSFEGYTLSWALDSCWWEFFNQQGSIIACLEICKAFGMTF